VGSRSWLLIREGVGDLNEERSTEKESQTPCLKHPTLLYMILEWEPGDHGS